MGFVTTVDAVLKGTEEHERREKRAKKKPNTTAIGNRTAAKGKAELEREGFKVQPAKKGRAKNGAGFWFNYGEDFFGLFDAIALGDCFDLRFVQFHTRDSTASGGQTAAKRDAIEAFARCYDYAHGDVTLEVWTWVKRRGWIKEILMQDYTWSKREHFNSKEASPPAKSLIPGVSPRGAAGGKADRPAVVPDGKSGFARPASPTPSELNRLQNYAFREAFNLSRGPPPEGYGTTDVINRFSISAKSIRAYAASLTPAIPVEKQSKQEDR